MASGGKTLNAAITIAGPSINNLQTQASKPSKGSSGPSIECLAHMRHSGNYISLVNKCVLSSEELCLKAYHGRTYKKLVTVVGSRKEDWVGEEREENLLFTLSLLLSLVPLIIKK